MKLTPQFLVDKHGNRKSVLLSMKDWEYVLECLEDLADIREYHRAKAESREEDYVPFEQAVREINADYNQ